MFDTGSDSSRIRRLLRAARPVTPPPPELTFCPLLAAVPCRPREARHDTGTPPLPAPSSDRRNHTGRRIRAGRRIRRIAASSKRSGAANASTTR